MISRVRPFHDIKGLGWQIQRFREKFMFNRYIGRTIMNRWSSLEDYVIWCGQENSIICPALDLSKVGNKWDHHFSLTHHHFIDELFWCRCTHKSATCGIIQQTLFQSFVKEHQEWVIIAIYIYKPNLRYKPIPNPQRLQNITNQLESKFSSMLKLHYSRTTKKNQSRVLQLWLKRRNKWSVQALGCYNNWKKLLLKNSTQEKFL